MNTFIETKIVIRIEMFSFKYYEFRKEV